MGILLNDLERNSSGGNEEKQNEDVESVMAWKRSGWWKKKTKKCKSTCTCRHHIFYQNKGNQHRFRLVLCDKGCDNANCKRKATRKELPATNVKYPVTRESIPRNLKKTS